jgi:hypothetical protein
VAKDEGGSRIESGTTDGEDALPTPGPSRKREGGEAPRWTIAFLRALERTGEVRASAVDAGVDHTTAYARRRAHPDFAAAWDTAVYQYTGAKEAREAEAIERLKAPLDTLGTNGRAAPLLASSVLGGGQVKRASKERWGERKERIFFEELAATANVRMAAGAAGVSTQAVFARRLRDRLFAAKWDAVARSARAVIDMHLVEQAQRSFDPDALDLPDGAPRVTIDQAIKISQIGAARAKGEDDTNPFQNACAESVDEIRERLIQKLQRLRRRERPKLLAQGWSYDEEYDRDVPPGWVKIPGNAVSEGQEPSRE